jgi:hypothetical protein
MIAMTIINSISVNPHAPWTGQVLPLIPGTAEIPTGLRLKTSVVMSVGGFASVVGVAEKKRASSPVRDVRTPTAGP